MISFAGRLTSKRSKPKRLQSCPVSSSWTLVESRLMTLMPSLSKTLKDQAPKLGLTTLSPRCQIKDRGQVLCLSVTSFSRSSSHNTGEQPVPVLSTLVRESRGTKSWLCVWSNWFKRKNWTSEWSKLWFRVRLSSVTCLKSTSDFALTTLKPKSPRKGVNRRIAIVSQLFFVKSLFANRQQDEKGTPGLLWRERIHKSREK